MKDNPSDYRHTGCDYRDRPMGVRRAHNAAPTVPKHAPHKP